MARMEAQCRSPQTRVLGRISDAAKCWEYPDGTRFILRRDSQLSSTIESSLEVGDITRLAWKRITDYALPLN